LSVTGYVEFAEGRSMIFTDVYMDLDGHEITLAGLDAEEHRLVARLCRRAQTHPDWTDFDNYWTREVGRFYDARGVPRRRSRDSVPVCISQDLSSRLGIVAGLVRLGDWRDDLEDLVRNEFPTRRAFCGATGISEDMLSHVLAGRKDLSLATLSRALERIGYALHIRRVPEVRAAPAARKKQTG
jgi:hypothetical protein